MHLFSFCFLAISQAFVDTNPDLRWCPYPNCGRAIRVSSRSSSKAHVTKESRAKSVDCGMGHFCCWWVLFTCNVSSLYVKLIILFSCMLFDWRVRLGCNTNASSFLNMFLYSFKLKLIGHSCLLHYAVLFELKSPSNY